LGVAAVGVVTAGVGAGAAIFSADGSDDDAPAAPATESAVTSSAQAGEGS
jgi:hypothetical protein